MASSDDEDKPVIVDKDEVVKARSEERRVGKECEFIV